MAKTYILRAGRKRMVHVLVSQLQKRFATGEKCPLVAVRSYKVPRKHWVYREVEFLGKSTLCEIANPIPDTSGRGICVVITDGAIRVTRD